MSDGCCSQCVTLHLWHSFNLTLLPCSSVRSLIQDIALLKLLQHQAFPWQQFFKNYSSMGAFHWVEFFRNGLLHCGPPHAAVLTRKPVLVWAHFHGHCSCQKIHSYSASFRAFPPAAVWGPPQAAVWTPAPA